MHQCKICSDNLHSNVKLSIHIRKTHGMPTKLYYDTYIKKCDESICVVCGKDAVYKNFVLGYSKTCCRSCSAKNFRTVLKNDPVRNKKFVDKVTNNMREIWESREMSGEKCIIFKKVSDTSTTNNGKLTVQERKDKFGWLNKLSGEERDIKIKQMVKPLQEFYKNISNEDMITIMNKRTKTTIERYGKSYPEHLCEISDDGNKRLCELLGVEYTTL